MIFNKDRFFEKILAFEETYPNEEIDQFPKIGQIDKNEKVGVREILV